MRGGHNEFSNEIYVKRFLMNGKNMQKYMLIGRKKGQKL